MEEHNYIASTIAEVCGVLWSLKDHVLFPAKPVTEDEAKTEDTKKAAEETLFDRLGGLEKINPLVDTIYKNTEQIL